MKRATPGVAGKPSVDEWLNYMRAGLSIWEGAGVGKTREDLRKALEQFYGHLSAATFKKYLYERLPPDYARFLAAFRKVLDAIDPSLEVRFEEMTGRRPVRREDIASRAAVAFESRGRALLEFKLTKRDLLAKAALHHHAAIIEEPDLPLITKSAWLPDKLVPLKSVDREHGWIEVAEDKSPIVKDIFDQRTCAEWSKKLNPDMILRNFVGYRLKEVVARNGSLRFTFQRSDYFAFYNTCEALAFELADWCLRHPNQLPNPRMQELGIGRSPEAMLDLSSRNCVPGLNALFVVFNGKDGHHFFIHDRSDPERPLAEAQNMFHVVPSGTFGPDSYKDSYHERDFSLHRTVFREFAEELLGEEKLSEYEVYGEDFMNDPKVRRFVDGEREGHFKVFFLGLGLDPVNTKPDFVLCIAMDARGLGISDYKSIFRKNWEGNHFVIPWSQSNLLDWASKPTVYPAGAACLKLAATRHFRALDKLFGR